MDQEKTVKTHIRNQVPIVFAVDDHYVLYLAVTIKSILVNSSAMNRYELIILEKKLSNTSKSLLSSTIEGYHNFSIRFLNVASIMETYGKNCLYTCFHFSRAIYYRLFLAEILTDYEKIIYQDSDLIIQKDPAEILHINLENSYLAVGHEWLCLSPRFRIYLKATLKWKGTYNTYFASGHMVMNLKKIKHDKLIYKFMKTIRENQNLRAPDQDTLNIVCQGNVTFLPPEWNICWHWKDFLSSLILKKNNVYGPPVTRPSLIHYASAKKPWNTPEEELADLWWSYANLLSFKEKIHKKALEDRCRFLQKNYEMLVNSIPWKITKPLREIYDFLKYDVLEFSKLFTGQKHRP